MSGVTLLMTSSFFLNDTATTEIYTLSLHDALPISKAVTKGIAIGSAVIAAVALFGSYLTDVGKVQLQVGQEVLTGINVRSEEHTSELQSQSNLVCRLLLEKKKTTTNLLI